MEAREVSIQTPESPRPEYQIHFEPGIHSFTRAQLKDTRDRFLKGDLTAHDWNPQIARRMRQYAPSAVGLDTSSSTFNTDFAGLAWDWLPGSPKEMSGRDSIYVVAGDILYQGLLPEPEAKQYGDHGDQTISKEFSNLEEKGFLDYVRKASVEGTTTLAWGTILLGVAILKAKHEAQKRSFTKRKFWKAGLKGLAGGALLALSGARLAPVVKSYSQDSRWSEVFDAVTEVTKPRFSNSLWLDGRTAGVIAKTMDGMKEMGLPDNTVGSIVMGYPHAYEAGKLMKSREARKTVLRGYAKEMIENVNKVLDKVEANLPKEERLDRVDIKDAILTYLCMMDVYEVTEPEIVFKNATVNTPGLPYDPLLATQFAIQRKKHMLSPEIKEALIGLGDPDRFFEEQE